MINFDVDIGESEGSPQKLANMFHFRFSGFSFFFRELTKWLKKVVELSGGVALAETQSSNSNLRQGHYPPKKRSHYTHGP